MISSSRAIGEVAGQVEYFFTKPTDYDSFMVLGAVINSLLSGSEDAGCEDAGEAAGDLLFC